MRRTIFVTAAGLAVLAISATGCKSSAHASATAASSTAVVATQTVADATSAAPAAASAASSASPAGSPSPSASGSPSPSVAPASVSSPAAGNSGGGEALPKDCPTAAEVSAGIGFTVPAPLPSSDADSLSCSYLTGGINTVEINYQTTAPGTTAASLQAQLQAGAAAGSTVAPISGYGQAAFTTSGATPGVGMLVLDGGIEFSLTGGTAIPGLENLAKKLLAG
jgi:hypothetical protein